MKGEIERKAVRHGRIDDTGATMRKSASRFPTNEWAFFNSFFGLSLADTAPRTGVDAWIPAIALLFTSISWAATQYRPPLFYISVWIEFTTLQDTSPSPISVIALPLCYGTHTCRYVMALGWDAVEFTTLQDTSL